MDMDADAIESDLRSLKRLYGLLRKDGDGTSNPDSHLLDQHARRLLKNLLDAATKRILKVIAGQVEASGTLSPTQLQQPDESFEEQPVPQSRLSMTAEGSRSCEQETNTDKDGLVVTLWKEKRFTPQWSQTGAREQSLQCTTDSGPQHREKRCRVCQRNTVKQLEPIGEMHFYDVARDSSRYTDLQHQQTNESDRYLWNSKWATGLLMNNKSDESKHEKAKQRGPFVSNLDGIEDTDVSSERRVTDIAQMCNSDIEATSKPEEVDCLSKEASETIKQIELCISGLNIGTDYSQLLEKNCARACLLETKSAAPEMRTQYGTVPTVGTSLGEENFMTRSNLLCGLSSQRVVDPVGYPILQLPSATAEERNKPYLPWSQVQPTKAILKQSTNNFIRRGQALQRDMLVEKRKSIDVCKFPTKKVDSIYGQNVMAIVDKIESGKWTMSREEHVPSQTHNVKRYSAALDLNETSYAMPSWPATFSSASEMENPYQSHMVMENERNSCRLSQTDKPSCRYMNLNNGENIQLFDPCLNGFSTVGAHGENHLPEIIGESLVNKKPSQLLVSSGFHENQPYAQHKDRIPKNRHHTTAARTSLQQQQESEGTATDSYSNWMSQQTSSHDSDDDSEEYSLADGTRDLQYVTSSRSSGSRASPLSPETGSQYSSYTSNSEEFCSSSNGERACEVTSSTSSSSSSSRSEGYSSYKQPIRSCARPTYMSKMSTPRKSGPNRTHKANSINREKQSGIWKRLKHNLAVVFHHHHHHHYHNRGDHTDDQTKMSRNTSLDKGKVLNFKRQDRAHGEKAVEKITKSLVHEQKQHSHFHGLVEGLLKHVRHSKQSKPAKGTTGQLAKGQLGGKKTLKKSHWWKLLQQHGGAKLPSKTHMKLALGEEKARIKALSNRK